MFFVVVQEIDKLAKKRLQFDNGVIVVNTMLSLQTKQSRIPPSKSVATIVPIVSPSPCDFVN